MKAIVYKKYGAPEDVLRFEDVPKPVPKDDEVLVKVFAASINEWDWSMVRAAAIFVRFWGLFKPRHQIPGADIAGTVEAVGSSVTRFKPGDEVFGDLNQNGWGGYAEYVCSRENGLAPKPPSLTFEQAAAIPQAGVMALQGIRDYGKVQPGDKVLINGAGGAVGTFAVQIAKMFGADVTAVDTTAKLDKIRALGADHLIDFTREDFTRSGQRYDLILDVSGFRSVFDHQRALAPGGKCFYIGGSMPRILQTLFMGPIVGMASGKKLWFLGLDTNKDLAFFGDAMASGKVTPVIDKVFPLADTVAALQHYESGDFVGKIVISVG
ncbi:MAG: NAD(P)-dependent alcohol dehydrogenase [Alphaproteobacteria bacterium]|jgi:NADPH:quinone reductase-like Zn-dependent oxidoreductase|nr:NAD(P)-dependent alcohol dehydrogenase [Alphaproteobacteria bacterium]